MTKYRWNLCLVFVIMLCFFSGIAGASPVPEGFCGYSWGTPVEDFPSTTFIMHPESGGKSMYQIDNISDINVSNLSGNVVPSKIFVFFLNNQLFQGRLEIERRYGGEVHNFLISKYGTPSISTSRFITTYKWENDQSILLLSVSVHNVMIEVIEANYYRAEP